MNLDWSFPYSSQRMPIFAKNVVTTSQPLAAQAGMEAFRRGGNAVDAALATAMALTVVEPTMNGIGGDVFAIIWDGQKLHALNASGRAPMAWSPEYFSKFGKIPMRGWNSVTVPGAVSAWVALSEKFGKLKMEDHATAAIKYAQNGFPVSPITSHLWKNTPTEVKDVPGFMAAFCPQGRAPEPGELFSFADQARTLDLIAQSKGQAFYRGELAQSMVADAQKHGGALSLQDLSAHEVDWVDTLSMDFAGYTLHELPPNGMGIASLIALGILNFTDLKNCPLDSVESTHLQIEAIKLAFADAAEFVADIGHMKTSVSQLLDPAYHAKRARLIDAQKARPATHGAPAEGGTVYLTAADQNGMMVSFIQSNWWGFGSGVVVPGTGISLHNRGTGFNLIPGHCNEVGGGKRPYHTILPGFVTKGGQPVMSFGVMGGSFQAQGHVQMLVRTALYQQNPQAASDALRWRFVSGLEVKLEEGTSESVVKKLRDIGHQISVEPKSAFGGAQLIWRQENGIYAGASDHRKDGQAVGF